MSELKLNGKLDMAELRKSLEKKKGDFKGYNLREANPTDVTEWIPTGSRWLDSIICRGKLAGIPVRKITELAGLNSAGKSYMAAQIAKNAQDMNFNVIYFDSENAIDSNFLELMGIDLDNFLYVPAKDVEYVFEVIEQILASSNRTLFIWDSLALTPCRADIEGDFDPSSSIGVKARVLSKAMQKLLIPIANTNSAMLVLNQLKDNIETGTGARQRMMVTPYFTPGGKTLPYAYSLRIWLTRRKSKAGSVLDEKGFDIGTEVTARLEKSRFGTYKRRCTFKIVWGDPEHIGIMDRESWLEAIKNSPRVELGRAYKFYDKNGEVLFSTSKSKWLDKLDEDPDFYNLILELMDEEVIRKFDERTENAESFYGDDEEPEESA